MKKRPNILFQIAILFGLMVLCLFLCVYLAVFLLPPLFGISDASNFLSSINAQIENVYASLFIQSLSSAVGMFLLPALVFSQVLRYPIGDFFKINKLPSALKLLLALVIIISGGVFINLIVEFSQQIPLPESLAFLRNGQEKTDVLLESFFSIKTLQHFLLLLFCMALLPALAEEFFFRGVLQNLFVQSGMSPFRAMLVSGLTFSFMHLAFDNFMAIWLMGFVLGWLYHYSGSLWTSIFAHFVNNASVVLLKYAYFSGITQNDWTSDTTSISWYFSLGTGIVMIGGMWLMRKISGQKQV